MLYCTVNSIICNFNFFRILYICLLFLLCINKSNDDDDGDKKRSYFLLLLTIRAAKFCTAWILFRLCSYTTVAPSKTVPVFSPKRRKNHTLWGSTYKGFGFSLVTLFKKFTHSGPDRKKYNKVIIANLKVGPIFPFWEF